ncbi:MAG: inositol monophosphatase [Candidatus Lokiarchaeota archaeon]|nr:inositol monophosphatase [Candidatus Lokiarchaeota archaeon]
MDEFLDFSKKIAKEAGNIVMKYYNSHEDLNIDYKKDNSIVTKADIESEKFIRNSILKKYPDHTIIAEEEGLTEGNEEFIWCVDPLDGTTNFSIHYPFFCISIALYKKKEPIVGVIYFPSQDELYYCKKGSGSFLNRKKIHVSSQKSLKNAIIAFSSNKTIKTAKNISNLFLEFKMKQSQKLRHFGSAALELSYVASGRISGFLSLGTKIWDISAGMLLIREAKGKVTKLNGNDYTFEDRDEILIGSNRLIHEDILKIVNDVIKN